MINKETEGVTTFLKRFFGRERRVVEPLIPTTGEQPSVPEAKFSSRLYSDRQMVVNNLKANPGHEGEIIAGYLQSPKLLKDTKAWGEFLGFWFQEFFQKVDTGSIENLSAYIKTADAKTLPRELQKAKEEIFNPLFKLTNGEEENFFSQVMAIGLPGVAYLLGKTVFSSGRELPNLLKKQYLEYVNEQVRIEAGIIKSKPAEPEPGPARAKKRRSVPILPPAKSESQIKAPPPPKAQYSYSIILGPNTESRPVKNLEGLSQLMKKVNDLGPIKANMVWSRLTGLSQMTQGQIPIMERYGETVAYGQFKGWNEIRMGKKWLIIFQIQDQEILFRVGSHEDVYATGRRKPRDGARSL